MNEQSIFNDGNNRMFDAAFVGQSFYETVVTLGEDIYFIKKEVDAEGNEIEIKQYHKMCLDEGIRKSQATSEKMYDFIGEMTFPDRMSQDTLRGQYFYRVNEPHKTYMLLSTISSPYTEKLANVEIVECNEVIDVGFLTEGENPDTGEIIKVWNPLYNKVKVFTKPRIQDPEETKAGIISRSTIEIILPNFCLLSTEDFIKRNEIKIDSLDRIKRYWGEQEYNILTVDTTMSEKIVIPKPEIEPTDPDIITDDTIIEGEETDPPTDPIPPETDEEIFVGVIKIEVIKHI